jgi:hypothetical protein
MFMERVKREAGDSEYQIVRRSPRCCKPDDSDTRHCAHAWEGTGKKDGKPEDRPEALVAPIPGVMGRVLLMLAFLRPLLELSVFS